jgi:hypothetical protein
MRKFKILVIAAVAVLIFAGVALAGVSAGIYEIPWDAYSSGGEQMASANYKMISTAGQELVGGTSSDSYQVGAGFWTSTTEDVESYDAYLPLVLGNY